MLRKLLILCFFASSLVAAQPAHVPDELILGIPDDAKAFRFRWNAYGIEKIMKLGTLPLYLVRVVDGKSAEEKKSEVGVSLKLAGVSSIDLNYFRMPDYVPQSVPNDPLYQNGSGQFNLSLTQWDLAVNEPAGNMNAWSLSGPIASTLTAIDTGVLVAHEDFTGRFLPGRNVLLGNSDVNDTAGHGTHVTGIMAGLFSNGLGIAGMAGNLPVLPVKAVNSGSMVDSNAILAINWAVANGARIINISYSGTSISGGYQTAIDDAVNNFGCVFAAGSGNSGVKESRYPASYPPVISVGASGGSDEYVSYSTRSDEIVLAAPSGSTSPPVPMMTTDNDSTTDYGGFGGTSLTAPQVASLAAALLSNGVVHYEVISRMARTADKIDAVAHSYATVAGKTLGTWNEYLGYGRINFYRAMKTLVAPVLDSATALLGQVDLSFSAPPLNDMPTSGYHVYRAAAAGGPYTRITSSPVAGPSYSDTGVSSGQTLYYVVTALDSHPETFETRKSNERSVTVPFPSPTVTPTFTATPTATPTPTITQSFTASPTPSITPTWTETPVFKQAGRGELFVAPVPALRRAWINFGGTGGLARIRIYNARGEVAWRGERPTQAGQAMRVEMDLEGWSWGVYYAVVEMGGGKLGPAKFLVGQ